MSIDREEVKHIALLSRLELSEEEVDLYTGHLDGILNYVEKLKSIDVSHVEPMSHAIPMFNVLREDEIQPSLSSHEALENAPDREFPYFRVPRVTE
ncbi:MAG: Asp-tRNA(Asn)/Glu-tRNA(Gln) amidotransferase subunit GatC [Candidatus Omnitrophota bacterium]|jgi:aspartyl-tRNA(Asn)/glutamyl-tRNA(Gln) amidotransferase subunit C|nr:MAG: Asp-tRNA(Asn)/Glu-tRNA(Gln) amidotransferase subunit GatC [Candidatus Omnitrophota bacterium]